MPKIRKAAKDTLAAVEMDRGDVLEFTLASGRVATIELLATDAEVTRTTVKRLRIEECYRGEDCWLGAYNGASAHGGLDVNHPPGTPLWAPVDLDEQFYFGSLEMGHKNNRWRGLRRWADGSEWILEALHMTELTVPEHMPLRRGKQFAWGAGVHSGVVGHSHFVFKVYDRGELVYLDPWILFWQTYRDQESGRSRP